MIDCDVQFGAYVPKVPQIYKDAALDQNGKVKQQHSDSCGCAIRNQWTACTLLSITQYNHNTSIIGFQLNDPNIYLNLPIMAHLLVKAPGCEHGDGGDAVRPYTTVNQDEAGKFSIMVKRYDEWGVREEEQIKQKCFLYVKTNHSYKPPGAVSNYIHNLIIGQSVQFKFDPSICSGKIAYPFSTKITAITMIAVGIGVVPMIRILRQLLDHNECLHVEKIRLLYGVRTVEDILSREQLDKWHDDSCKDKEMNGGDYRFQVCYCVGSRYNNITFAAKTDAKTGPPLPRGYDAISDDRKQIGWVSSATLLQHGASNAKDVGHAIFICGLPAVYMKLAGPRSDPTVSKDSQLYELGYRDEQVIKF